MEAKNKKNTYGYHEKVDFLGHIVRKESLEMLILKGERRSYLANPGKWLAE